MLQHKTFTKMLGWFKDAPTFKKLSDDVVEISNKLDNLSVEQNLSLEHNINGFKVKVDSMAPYAPVCNYGNVVIATNNQTVWVSEDNGETWKAATLNGSTFTGTGISKGIMSESGIILIQSGNPSAKIYRTRDMENYDFELVDTSSIEPFGVPLANGIAHVERIYGGDPNVVMFAEYETPTNEFRVFAGTDFGAVWTEVFSQPKGATSSFEGISHFHSVDFLGDREESQKRFVVTSGDSDPQVHWWYTDDYGQTWNEYEEVQQDPHPQKYRTLSVRPYIGDKVIWSADALRPNSGVYIADRSDLSKYEVLTSFANVSYGIEGQGHKWCAVDLVSGRNSRERLARIYVTLDGGKSWHIVHEQPVQVSGGFQTVYGPSADGSFYVRGVANYKVSFERL